LLVWTTLDPEQQIARLVENEYRLIERS